MPTPQGLNVINLNASTLNALFAAWLSETMKGGPFEVTQFEADDDQMRVWFRPTTPTENPQ